MKKIICFILILSSGVSFSKNGSELLMNGKNSDGNVVVKRTVSQLVLSDPFLVQVYGKMKGLQVRDEDVLSFLDAVLRKDFERAVTLIPKAKKSYKKQRLINIAKLYTLYHLGMAQSFFNLWTNEAINFKLLETELGVSLDQVVGINSSKWIIDNGIVISLEQQEALLNIKNRDSNFNLSAQAFMKLKKGAKALDILAFIKLDDPLVLPLVKSAVIDLAVQNKLAEAGSVIKTYLEPRIEKTKNINEISEYYLLLGRLLYQAGAYTEAQAYYKRIPDESRHFLTARLESLWISTRADDLSQILGEVKSLGFFKEEFLPERYLVEAMANLKLCNFKEVQQSITKFVDTNKSFASLIKTRLSESDPKAYPQQSFYRDIYNQGIERLPIEIKKTSQYGLGNEKILQRQLEKLKQDYKNEVVLEWQNKQKLIEKSLRKMRFVKVEFLSTMRRLKNKLARNQESDSISSITSSIDKSDKVEFPYDGVVFGDELFHMYSKVQALCLGGKGVK